MKDLNEVISSDLPELEKTDTRLGDEAQLVVDAGLVTTSWALTLATFHFASKADVSSKLRKELVAAGFATQCQELKKLSYLNACVLESVHLSHGVVVRAPRLAPDQELTYGGWTVLQNTPVSMATIDVLMTRDYSLSPSLSFRSVESRSQSLRDSLWRLEKALDSVWVSSKGCCIKSMK
ncbi:hypothetical protein CkaCkLH20_07745 [Colletotrichum karsti]|uniref:Uncharacterized protein n=1 Tax=Colletotrichum karsti TaxID=1095194 RepID=A0A9P6I1A2_9PEZI|nr:uncharacterized protein CkaCkLH20_07745 [Colletotrichum karsti]KAF9874608.1 hypothetical protein CkaCkLH20_07745 [Colletotrichum karsti]